jgi:hypothetical protein
MRTGCPAHSRNIPSRCWDSRRQQKHLRNRPCICSLGVVKATISYVKVPEPAPACVTIPCTPVSPEAKAHPRLVTYEMIAYVGQIVDGSARPIAGTSFRENCSVDPLISAPPGTKNVPADCGLLLDAGDAAYFARETPVPWGLNATLNPLSGRVPDGVIVLSNAKQLAPGTYSVTITTRRPASHG